MFQFRRFPAYAYFVQRTLTEYCSAGFPHSVISGSMLMCSSPKLIAACHDLHRLLMPRHSPCALISLTSSERTSYPSLPCKHESSLPSLRLLPKSKPLRWVSIWFPKLHPLSVPLKSMVLMNYAGFTEVLHLAPLFLPFISKVPQSCFLPSVACSCTSSFTLFSFQGASLPASFKTRLKHSLLHECFNPPSILCTALYESFLHFLSLSKERK